MDVDRKTIDQVTANLTSMESSLATTQARVATAGKERNASTASARQAAGDSRIANSGSFKAFMERKRDVVNLW